MIELEFEYTDEVTLPTLLTSKSTTMRSPNPHLEGKLKVLSAPDQQAGIISTETQEVFTVDGEEAACVCWGSGVWEGGEGSEFDLSRPGNRQHTPQIPHLYLIQRTL